MDGTISAKKLPYGERLITAIAVGGFLIIVGLIFALTPDLWQKITDFFNNITTASFPYGGPNSTISLPAPTSPEDHSILYTALMQFAIGIGVLQIIILSLRLYYHSRIGRTSETVGNLIFWFGAAFLVNIFLLAGTLAGWFEFWGALIILIGVSIVARAIVYLAKR